MSVTDVAHGVTPTTLSSARIKQPRSTSRISTAWTARGQRLVEGHDCVERGYLAVAVAEQQLREGQPEAAHATADQAFGIGESFRDADLTAAARHAQGRALIQRGDVAAGLKRLDETMLAVVAGELLPTMTVRMYCSVIDTCRQVYALERAREWTSAFSSVCEEQPDMVGFTGVCLVHRAEILQLQGAWPDALTEACRACERAQRAGRKPPGAALYQQAEIHRLRGEFAKAEDAYRAASELGFEPQPGLALLRLAQGRLDAPYEAARVRVLMGQACHALGDDEAAALELEAARSVFERLGAQPELAHLDAPMAPASRSPLTARELHVLRLVSTGRTNKEIAEELSLSERTIDRHVTNILTKLDVRSRTAATAYAYDHKLF